MRSGPRAVTAVVDTVLLVTRNFPPLVGGMERLNQHIAEQLDHDCSVYLVGPRGAEKHVTFPNRVSTVPSKPVYRFLAGATASAVHRARRTPPSLVIAGSGLAAIPAWLAARAAGVPWIVYLHGLDLVVNNRWYQKIVVPVIRRADGWLANSRSTADIAVSMGMNADGVHVLHPGVDVPVALPGDAELQQWRRAHGFGDRPLILSVGRITRRKGLGEFVLHALPTILKKRPDTLLLVVGDEATMSLVRESDGPATLREAVLATKTEQSVRMLGRIGDDELRIAYCAASAHVFPVRAIRGDIEGFGMVAIEAAACGLPTVAFAEGGVVDAVEDGRSGHLVKPGDYDGFASRVISLIDTGKNRESMERCREFAHGYAWPRFGSRLREYCKLIISEGTGGRNGDKR